MFRKAIEDNIPKPDEQQVYKWNIYVAIDKASKEWDKTCKMYYTRDKKWLITILDVIYPDPPKQVQSKIEPLPYCTGLEKPTMNIATVVEKLNEIILTNKQPNG